MYRKCIMKSKLKCFAFYETYIVGFYNSLQDNSLHKQACKFCKLAKE